MTNIIYDGIFLESGTTGMARASHRLIRATAELIHADRLEYQFSIANFSGTILPRYEIPNTTVKKIRIPPRLGIYGAIYLPFLSPIHHIRPKPDAIFWNSLVYFGKDIPGIKQAVCIHDLRCLRFPDMVWPKELWLTKAGIRRLVKSQCSIVVPSESTKRDVIEYCNISPERINVVNWGIDDAFHMIDDADRLEDAAKRLALNDKRFIFYVGQYVKHKNLPLLFRAFREVRRRCGQDVFLVLAGDSAEKMHECADQAEYDEADRRGLRCLCYLSDDDLIAAYNLATCMAFPSLNEGFGFPVGEAMACGCPVVASKATSIPEIVGQAGILLDPHDPDAWVDALSAIFQDESLTAELQENGLKRVESMKWENTARKILALLT